MTNGSGTLSLEIILPEGYKLNELAPLTLKWWSTGDAVVLAPESATQSVGAPTEALQVPANFVAGNGFLFADLVVYYCEVTTESLCLIEQIRLELPVTVAAAGLTDITVTYTIELPAGVADN